jgi:hypothetical protein
VLENYDLSRYGAILFAFNTKEVNYFSIAENAARLIKKHLHMPVTLVTDSTFDLLKVNNRLFDEVKYVNNEYNNIRLGYGNGTQWRNGARHKAYELSHYEYTLLLDTDLLVLDNNLLKLYWAVDDYKIFYDNNAIQQPEATNMGVTSLPYVWATGIVFKKCETSKMLFDLVGKIQRNYPYYRGLYNIKEPNFRNDYAFAIANYMLNGYSVNDKNSIPWPLTTFNGKVTDIELKEHEQQVIVRTDDKAYLMPKQNMHVMDKDYLQSESYQTLVDTLCQSDS